MSILPQPVEVFVTFIENDGPLLRLWGQLERTQAIFVERLILQLTEQFERGLGIPSNVEVGQLCCARYSDGVYYRARITSPVDPSTGQVAVHFIDYGNSEIVAVRNIRSLEESMLTPLASVDGQASAFFLAGVIPLKGSWDEDNLTSIRQTICYEELKCVIVGQVANKRLLRVFYNNEDFAQTLITQKIGVTISIHAQQILLQGYYGLNTAPPQFPGFSVPPPLYFNQPVQSQVSLPSLRLENCSQPNLVNVPAVRETVRVFKSPVLEVHSEHLVYVSYVEDGPSSFAIQLQAAEETLSSITNEMNNTPPIPLTQPLMPGSVCLGRFSEDKTLCRAVVMAVLEDRCRLYYVDFGNSEILPHSEIFELPQQFINPKVMALRFTLSGLKNLTVTNDTKSYFKELVTEKLLRLRVVPPEGPPLKQYGELYLNGTNILDLLVQKIKERHLIPPNYSDLTAPQIGTRNTVKVSYVINTSHFYLHLEANVDALNSVMLAVETVCSSTMTPLNTSQLRAGSPCCAQYKEDDKWYRAKILSVSADVAEVMFVDYGNTDFVPFSCLRTIGPELIQILKTQALACCLSGFQDNTNDELGVQFEEITLEKTLTMVVVDTLQNGRVLVELYDGSSGSVSIADQLLGHSMPVAAGIQNQVTEPKVEVEAAFDVDKWEESPAEVASERKPRTWGGDKDKERFNRGSRDENKNEFRSKRDDRDGGGKPWQSRDSWRQNSGDDERKGKSWQENSVADGTGHDNRDFKKKSWNQDDTGNRSGGGRWNSDAGGGQRNKWGENDDAGDGGGGRQKRWNDNENGGDYGGGRRQKWNDNEYSGDSGGGRRKKWNDNEDSGGFGGGRQKKWNENENDGDFGRGRQKDSGNFGGGRQQKWDGSGDNGDFAAGRRQKWNDNEDGGGRRNKWRDDNESGKWKSNRSEDGADSFRGGQKPRGNRDRFEKNDSYQKSYQHEETSSINVEGGDEWDTEDTQTAASVQGALSEADIQVGDKKIVQVVFLENPGEFHVQVVAESENLTSVMEKIAAAYGEGSGNTLPVTSCKTGAACIARYAEDDTLYRAIIESVDGNSVVVLFCDYGNKETVPLDDIKEISPDYLNLPIQGISCKLLAVKPKEGPSWSEEEIITFTEATEGKTLEAHFVNKTNRVFEVVLTETEVGTNINEQLGAAIKDIEAAISSANKNRTKVSLVDENCELASPDQRYEIQNIAPETCDNVTVTWFISPKEFYCQSLSSKSIMNDLMNSIQSAYCNKTPVNSSVQVGSPVIAKFLTDGVLYRAEVKDIPDSSSLVVQFVDYGNCDLISRNNVWNIQKRFMLAPKQALFCSLRGVEPTESSWSRGSTGVDKYFEADKFQCTFHDSSDNKYNVTLVTPEGRNVSDDLVESGLAVAQVENVAASEGTSLDEESIELDLLPGQRLIAHITHVEGVAEFYVQLNASLANNIQALIAEHVQQPENMQPIGSDKLAVDSMCLATPDSEVWYRGKIIDCTSTTGVFIKFIDYGDGDEIPLDKVLAIPPSLTRCGAQAVKCCIMGSSNSIVPSEVEEKFKAELEDTDVILNIHSVDEEKLYVTAFNVDGKRTEILKDIYKESLDELEPLCPLPITSKSIKVWVSQVDSPDSLWLQKASCADVLAVLLENMYEFYESEGNAAELAATEDELCAAKSTSDEQWYRGKITSVSSEEGTCTVLFIDYGNSETIPMEQVKKLDASFLIPHTLAVCTSLALSYDSKEKVTSHLLEVVTDKQFTAVFALREDKWLVDLFDKETSVSKQLVKLGLARDYKEDLFPSNALSPSESLAAGTSCQIIVSYIDTPCSFWIQKVGDSDKITSLQEELQNIAAVSETMTSVPEVGSKCMGMYIDQWYRAVVTGSDSSLVTVRFIDYGNAESIEVSSEGLKSLPERLEHIPDFAHHCTLSENKTVLFDEEASAFMESLVTAPEDSVTAHVLNVGELIHVDLRLSNNTSVLEILSIEGLVEDTNLTSEIIAEDSTTVFVSHIKSPSEFWIQYKNCTNGIEEMETRMLEAENFSIVQSPSVHTLCAAQFSDGLWYRARILNQTDNEYQVLFVDYGNSSNCIELRNLPEDLINIPPLAKSCSLSKPNEFQEWSVEARKKFVEKVKGGFTEFQINVLKEGDIAVVSLLENGKKIEEELSACSKIDEITMSSTVSSKFNAYVSHVTSPSEFWVQMEDSSVLNEVSEKLVEAEEFSEVDKIEENVLYAANFAEDGNWYRAQLVSHSDDGIKVIYVDYGNNAVSTEFRNLPQDLQSLPPLAMKCSLATPDDVTEWPEIVNEHFMEIASDQTKLFEIEVLKYDSPVVVSMRDSGKKIEEELLKILVASRAAENVKDICDKNNEKDENEGISSIVDNTVSETYVSDEEEVSYNEKDEITGINSIEENAVSGTCVSGEEEVSENYSKIEHVIDNNMNKNNLKINEQQTAFLVKDTSCSVIVSHIENPCYFWIQKADDINKIKYLQTELQDIARVSDTLTSIPEIGSKCMGMYIDVWYRALVIESESSLVTVRFIDYGIVTSIEISSEGLKSLPERLEHIPEFAQLCTLSESETVMFDDEASTFMESLVNAPGESVIAHVLNVGELTHVDLRLSSGDSVLDMLIVEGLVTGTKISDDAFDEEDNFVEDDTAVYVSHVNSPSEFWIQYKNSTDEIEEMGTRMLEAENFPIIPSPSVGTLCAAQFSDGQWYRAKILNQTDNEYHVLFVDCGNSSNSTELRSLPDDIVNIPPLAKACSLSMPGELKEWSEAAQKMFVERVEEGFTEFQVNILEEGDVAVVSLLKDGKNVEKELSTYSKIGEVEDGKRVEEELSTYSKIGEVEDGKRVEEELSTYSKIGEVTIPSAIPTKFNAYVSYATSPSEFWIQVDTSYLNEVSEKLVEAEEFSEVDNIEENILYAVNFPEDGNWYRAQLLSHSGEDIKVIFVDYGNTSVCTEFRKLPEDLMEVPQLAIKLSLSVPDDISEWPEIVNEHFLEITRDQSKLFEIEVIKDGNPPVVRMRCSGENIETQLLEILEANKTRESTEHSCDNSDEEGNDNVEIGNTKESKLYSAEDEGSSQNNLDIESVDKAKDIAIKENEQDLDMQDIMKEEAKDSIGNESVNEQIENSCEDIVNSVKEIDLKEIEQELHVQDKTNEEAEKMVLINESVEQKCESFDNSMENTDLKDDEQEVEVQNIENRVENIGIVDKDVGEQKSAEQTKDNCESITNNTVKGIDLRENEQDVHVKDRTDEAEHMDNVDKSIGDSVERADLKEEGQELEIQDVNKTENVSIMNEDVGEQKSEQNENNFEDITDNSVKETDLKENNQDLEVKNKTSEEANTLESVQACDKNSGATIILEEIEEKPLALASHRTEHTERLVREISVQMKTPKSEIGQSAETIVSDRIRKGLSDGIRSAPSTPEVSRSDKILRRMLSQEELGRGKLSHNDRIVPGSISRGESVDEIHSSTPELAESEENVPDSISSSSLLQGKNQSND